jgi:anti-sigma B factor antagonist
MMSITVTVAEADAGLVVRIEGDAGVTEVPVLERELNRVLDRRPRVVVLDFARVGFISSLGMGALVKFRRGITSSGGQVRLAALPVLIGDAFKRARLDLLFPTFPTADAALAAPSPAATKPAS